MRASGWKTSTKKAKRKRWRKLHLGLDLVSGEIVCADLTTDDVGDPTALPELLDKVGGSIDKFIADGAHDGTLTRDLLTPWRKCGGHYPASQDRCSQHAVGAGALRSRPTYR